MYKQFREFQKGEFIVVGADTAHGGGDNCAAQFLSTKWLDVPLVYHSKSTATLMTNSLHDKLTEISKLTGVAPVIAYETNSGGDYELDRLASLNRYGDYRIYTRKRLSPDGRMQETGKLGWDTNSATRPKMLQDLKQAVESNLIHLYHRMTVDEMFSFIVSDSGKAEAEQGAHDDLVMSLAITWQLQQTEKPKKEEGGGVVEVSYGTMYKEAGVLDATQHEY